MIRLLLSASVAVGLCVAPVATANAAGAGFIESNVSNPVTALPPVSASDTRHCTVTAMAYDFANSYGAPFTGTLTPPSACQGPWTKVVLGWSVSVAGRQYDRLANVYVADTEVFRTSTAEPTAAGIDWHLDKDVSEFIPLLRTPEPVTVDLGNIVNSTYTGVYHVTLTFTYYTADARHPAASTADDVVTLAAQTPDGNGAYTLNAGQSASRTLTLPTDITGARMEIYARGGGCDEQWFTDVPNDLASKNPNFLCGGGPYREVEVTVDGTAAGVVQVYPVVYTGGIVPTLWRPIPAIDAFETQAYDLNLTPFAALLSDGAAHTVTLTPYGDNDYWLVDATLFLNESHHGRTTGALTRDTLAITPTLADTETPQSDGSTLVKVSTNRDWTVSGYVDTPHGRVTTTVTTTSSYSNSDLVSPTGQQQVVHQRDAGTVTAVTSAGRGPGAVEVSAWSYPIDVTSDVASYTDDNNFDLQATVDQQRHLSDSTWSDGRWTAPSLTDDEVEATGVLARANGVTSEADGSDSETYLGTTDTGACYHRAVAADHGLVTGDRTLPCRLP